MPLVLKKETQLKDGNRINCVHMHTPRRSVKKWTRPGQLLEFLEEMLESEILGRSVSYFQATWKVREPFHWIPAEIPCKNQVSDDF